MLVISFFFQAEDGIRDLVRSRGLGDVYKRQSRDSPSTPMAAASLRTTPACAGCSCCSKPRASSGCLLYTSDAADERSSVDLGGRRIIKKKTLAQQFDARTSGE